MRTALLAVPLVTLLAATPARADYTATMTSRMEGAGRPGLTVKSKLLVKGDRTRVEMSAPIAGVTIADTTTGKVLVLDEATRTYSETKAAPDDRGMDAARCSGKDVDACLAKQGFTKVGDGEANGRKCTIFEKVSTDDGRTTTTRLFRAKGASFPFVRLIVTSPEGGMTTDVTDATETKLDDALFQVPAGWKKSTAPAGTPAGAPTKEQLEAVMKKYGLPTQ